jgi:hypothetical protein
MPHGLEKVREKKTTRNAVINDLLETEFDRGELYQSKPQSEQVVFTLYNLQSTFIGITIKRGLNG